MMLIMELNLKMKIKNNLPYKSIFKRGSLIKENQDLNMISGVEIVVNDELPEHVNLSRVINKVKKIFPPSFFDNMHKIIIGQQKEFIDRGVNAMYKDGILYITHEQDDNADLYDDIIHEICHSVEEMHEHDVYGDGLLEDEFIRKRRFVLDMLAADGYNCSDIDASELKYSPKVDNFFHSEVGYRKLGNITRDIFVSPYSITSIREYWATAFENFWIKPDTRPFLKRSSPVLYQKIMKINKLHNL